MNFVFRDQHTIGMETPAYAGAAKPCAATALVQVANVVSPVGGISSIQPKGLPAIARQIHKCIRVEVV
jgi:hypothetical protein